MTEVRAGAEQRTCKPGQAGLATVWVRSHSEDDALRQARIVVQARHYQSFGELTIYREASGQASPTNVGLGAAEGDGLSTGYHSMRRRAIERSDGLFEIWFPVPG